MHFDRVTVRPRGFFDFHDRDFSPRFRELQYLARKRRQGRTQGLFFFNLRSKVVFLLDHRPQEKHEPVFPVLLSFPNGLLSTTQCEVIVIFVGLDHAFHRAAGNVSVPGAQQRITMAALPVIWTFAPLAVPLVSARRNPQVAALVCGPRAGECRTLQ